MNKLPHVCVILCNYNYSKYIGDAIRSVEKSDYPNKSLFISDDCSIDDSWKIIKLLCNVNDGSGDIGANIEIIKKKNVCYTGKIGSLPVYAYRSDKNFGPSRARNIALKLMWNQADLFKILDADDVLYSNCISESVKCFLEEPQLGAVYSNYDIYNERTGTLVTEYKSPYSMELLFSDCHIHSSCTISKVALSETTLYPENMRVCEDYALWAMISKKRLFKHIPKTLMMVRSHGMDSTSSVPVEVWNQCRAKVGEIFKA